MVGFATPRGYFDPDPGRNRPLWSKDCKNCDTEQVERTPGEGGCHTRNRHSTTRLFSLTFPPGVPCAPISNEAVSDHLQLHERIYCHLTRCKCIPAAPVTML